MLFVSALLILVQSLHLCQEISSHGYLADPPARSSAWLFDKDFSECCRYYNHIEMSCGGTYRQWFVNKGKCSICGEADDAEPKLLGLGGTMYLGKIVRTYTQGSVMPVTVVLTANHLGHFEFRVCSVDADPTQDATQSCLDLNILSTTTGVSNYPIEDSNTVVHVNLTLPADLLCEHCVFQWKYVTGNSWGVSNGRACLGCGKENEEFYGCSDIAIVKEGDAIVSSTPAIGNSSLVIVNAVKSFRKCTSTVTFSQSFDISAIVEEYCTTICSTDCAKDKIAGNEILYKGCRNTCDKLCACE